MNKRGRPLSAPVIPCPACGADASQYGLAGERTNPYDRRWRCRSCKALGTWTWIDGGVLAWEHGKRLCREPGCNSIQPQGANWCSDHMPRRVRPRLWCAEDGCNDPAAPDAALVGRYVWKPMCLTHRQRYRIEVNGRAESDISRSERKAHRRRVNRLNTLGSNVRRRVFDRDGQACSRCGATEKLEVDHINEIRIRPDMAGDESNLQVLCRPCHHRKTRAVNEALYAYARVTPDLQEFILRCVEDEFEEVVAGQE